MSDIPDDIWEAARNLRNAVIWQSNASVEPIARALLAQRQAGRAGYTAENDHLLDAHETRVAMHHALGEQYDELHAALTDLAGTVDTAYPGNAWTAQANYVLRNHRELTTEPHHG